MKRFQLGSTELCASEIGLGTSMFGQKLDQAASFAIMDRYLDCGGNLLDTAHVYAAPASDAESASEATIGAWMKARGNRNKVVLVTKGGHPENRAGTKGALPRLDESSLAQDLAWSLRSLQTDCIDLYFIHKDDPAVPVSGILDFLQAQVAAGNIRYYGCSNWSVQRMEEAAVYAVDHGYDGFVCNQLVGSLGVPSSRFMSGGAGGSTSLDSEMIAYHKKTKMPVMAAMSLANGHFQKRIAAGGERLTGWPGILYANEANDRICARLTELKAQGIPVNSVLYHYFDAFAFQTVRLMGFSSCQQLDEVVQDMQIAVSREIMDEMHELHGNGRG